MAVDTENDREGLAAEYALGTLNPAEKREAERLIEADTSFAQLAWRWQHQLSPMLDAIPPIAPPPGAFEEIMREIGDRPQPQTYDFSNVDTLSRTVRFWKRTAIAASFIVVALASTIVGRELTRPAETGGSFVAVLEGGNRTPAFVASVDLKKKVVHVVQLANAPEQNHSYELWAVGGNRAAPESLGVVDDGQNIAATRLGDLQPAVLTNTTFAISLEPKGGSPNGKPTTVLFTGKLVPLRKDDK
ncbi:MAG: anti-sigma factor [Methyloligellaceae bacterium]